jgi:hypothetical protein
MTNLLKYCQDYYQLSLGKNITEFDDTYFINIDIFSQDVVLNETSGEGYGYHEGKAENAILQIIELLIEVGQIQICENLIKILPSSPLKNYYV